MEFLEKLFGFAAAFLSLVGAIITLEVTRRAYSTRQSNSLQFPPIATVTEGSEKKPVSPRRKRMWFGSPAVLWGLGATMLGIGAFSLIGWYLLSRTPDTEPRQLTERKKTDASIAEKSQLDKPRIAQSANEIPKKVKTPSESVSYITSAKPFVVAVGNTLKFSKDTLVTAKIPDDYDAIISVLRGGVVISENGKFGPCSESVFYLSGSVTEIKMWLCPYEKEAMIKVTGLVKRQR